MSTQKWTAAVTHKVKVDGVERDELARVELSVDVRELLRKMGQKAAGAKTGKCVVAGGLVKVKVTQRLIQGAT